MRPSRRWTTDNPKGCLDSTYNLFATARTQGVPRNRKSFDFEWFTPITNQMSTVSVDADYVGSEVVLTQGGSWTEYIARIASLFPSIDS